MKNSFPVDILQAKQYGLKAWQKDFFWPVSDREFLPFCKDIERTMINYVDVLPQELSELFFVQRYLSFEYWHFLHAIKVIDRLKAQGIKPLCGDASIWYKELVTGTYTSGTPNIKISRYNLYTPKQMAQDRIKNLAKNIIFNPGLLKPSAGTSGKDIKTYGTIAPLMRQYIKELPHKTIFTSQSDYFLHGLNYKVPKKRLGAIENASFDVARRLKHMASQNGIPVLESHEEYLRRLTKNELIKGYKILYQVI